MEIESRLAELEGTVTGLVLAMKSLAKYAPHAEELLDALPDAATLIAQGMREAGRSEAAVSGFISSLVQFAEGLSTGAAESAAAVQAVDLLRKTGRAP